MRNYILLIAAVLLLSMDTAAYGTGMKAPEGAGASDTASQEDTSAQAAEALTAMYVPVGESSYIFVGTEKGQVFTVSFPDEIYDIDGKKITSGQLKAGNVVEIYGNGAMAESYPGQYLGVTKIQVVSEGEPSDADQYQEIVDGIYQEPDPAEPPSLNVSYSDSLSSVAAILPRGAYEWSYEGEDGQTQSTIADSAHILEWKEITELNLKEPTELTLYFSKEPEEVSVVRWPKEQRNQSLGEDIPEGEEAEAEYKDGTWYLPEAAPGYVYLVRGTWENGYLEAGFLIP